MTGRTKKDSVLPAHFAKEKGRSLEGKDFGTMVGQSRGGQKTPIPNRKAGDLAIKGSTGLETSNHFVQRGRNGCKTKTWN